MGIQIKICGITDPAHAAPGPRLGVDAVGLVFYPPSPRYVTVARAGKIVNALGAQVCAVGVFVNTTVAEILDVVKNCGLHAVQLHGRETRFELDALHDAGIQVLKHVNATGEPLLRAAKDMAPLPVLVECGRGKLPGGNAAQWDWAGARVLAGRHPFVLAGGLTPQNVARAMAAGNPDAVDVSSGVEARPGVKDFSRIQEFIDAVRLAPVEREPMTIFKVEKKSC